MEFDGYIPKTYVCFNGYKIRYIECNNRRKNYYGTSDCDTLVIIHGIGSSLAIWSKIVPLLSEYYRIIILDMIGDFYSNEIACNADYSSDFFVDFLLGILEKMHITRCVVVGHSFGTHLATEFAIESRNKVEKLVLVSATGRALFSSHIEQVQLLSALYPTYENAFKALTDMVSDPKIVTESLVKDFVNRMRLPNIKYGFVSYLLSMRDGRVFRGRISGIIAPTLILWGKNDKMLPLQYLLQQEYNEIPKSRFEIINDCGHIPPIEQPVEFNNITLRFLTKAKHD